MTPVDQALRFTNGTLYRYQPQRFASLCATLGAIRVGTLHDFRRSELARGVADPEEGSSRVVHVERKASFWTGDSSSASAANEAFRMIGPEPGGPPAQIHFENVTFEQPRQAPDCFVLSFSASYSLRALRSLEGAEACLRIEDPRSFCATLTAALRPLYRVHFVGLFRVSYQARTQAWNGRDWGHHPALVKSPDFKDQAEVRAIWIPALEPAIAPTVLGHRSLPAHCQLVPLPT